MSGKKLKLAIALPLGAAAALLVAGQVGLLKGKPPAELGAQDGRLAPPSPTPNSVTSQARQLPATAQTDYAAVEPLRFKGDAKQAFERAVRAVEALPNTVVIERKPGYLYAQSTSRWLGFVDDVELLLDSSSSRIDLRSASRLGQRDFGANRKRVEAIRAAFDAG